MAVFVLFLLALSLGSLTTFFWIPEEDLGRGYFQTNALVVVGLLGLAAAVAVLHPVSPFGDDAGAGGVALGAALLGGFLYHAAIWRHRWRHGRWAAALALAGTLAALLLAGAAAAEGAAGPPLAHRQALMAASVVTSALLLGWSLISMLLGHWYLVAPRLSFRHLVVFCRVLLAAVVLRAAAVGASLAAAASGEDALAPGPLGALIDLGGQGAFFWFRLLWGLAVPLTLAWMALHCARHRSNQSATGILYVLVVGTFIGEVTGYYLTVTTGVPV